MRNNIDLQRLDLIEEKAQELTNDFIENEIPYQNDLFF